MKTPHPTQGGPARGGHAPSSFDTRHTMIRVLVVDDHTIFRSGLRKLLSDEVDMAAWSGKGGAAAAGLMNAAHECRDQ